MPQQVNSIQQVTRTRHRTKSCPFCAEHIRFAAIKCRFCGEFLYGDRRETAAKYGPADPGTDRKDPPPDAANTAEEDDVLWFGRPSVLALTGMALKMGIFIGLCWVVYKYPVTRLVTYVPGQDVSPELLVQIESYLDLGALGLLVAAALALAWKVVSLKSIYYEVTPDRIEWSRGIFDRQVDNIDMFRVIDLKMRRSLLECLLGIGTVTLTTKDDSDPHFDFVKVRHCRYLYDVIKEAGLEADKTRNVIHLE